MATIIKDAPHSSDLKLASKGRKCTLKVSAAELDGIRNILENPKPPSPEMQAAWKDYQSYIADNPDSNW